VKGIRERGHAVPQFLVAMAEGGKDKARQDKTRQDKTRRDQTRQSQDNHKTITRQNNHKAKRARTRQ
jgi:hypothetical protein